MADHWIRPTTMRALVLICDEGSLPAALFPMPVRRDLCGRGKVARIEGDRIMPEPHALQFAESCKQIIRAWDDAVAEVKALEGGSDG